MAYSGRGGAIVRPTPPWSDREFLDNFCTVFVSFVLRLNRKIRVSRLLKTASKLALWGPKNKLCSGEEHSPSIIPSPRRLRRLVSSPAYWNPKYATGPNGLRMIPPPGSKSSSASYEFGLWPADHRSWSLRPLATWRTTCTNLQQNLCAFFKISRSQVWSISAFCDL